MSFMISTAKRNYSEKQFSLVRCSIGLLLLYQFSGLLPYWQEIFGNDQLAYTLPLMKRLVELMPSIFSNYKQYVVYLLAIGCVLSVCFILGVARKVVAFTLWLILVYLFAISYFAADFSKSFIGWWLLLSIFIPSENRFTLQPQKKYKWYMPQMAITGTWLVFGAALSVSAISKIKGTGIWLDGVAINYFLKSPLAASNFLADLLLEKQGILSKAINYYVLGTELLSLPLSLFAKTRPIIWAAWLLMFLGMFTLTGHKPIAVLMFIYLAFLFDNEWLSRRSKAK